MLEISGIDVYYGNVQALWDVSFTVGEGEIVTLIGANGAGKSTTLRALTGLLRPRKGKIVFRGEEIAGKRPFDLVSKGLVLIPEARQLWPGMTVAENLEMGAYTKTARKLRKSTIETVFEMFPRLKERAKQKAGTLSGGEQQMCAIGRGLMAHPKLLLLDEPSLGLAPLLVREVFRTLELIKRQGVTILLVEQNVTHALSLSDRAYVLETGRVGLSGPAKELLHDPRVKEEYLGSSHD